jgi:hypothetical protein
MARVLLEAYQIGDLLSVSGQVQAELRRLQGTERDRLVSEAVQGLQERVPLLKQRLQEVVVALVQPWMRKRYGIASLDELHEHVEYLSADRPFFKGAWCLLSRLLETQHSPLELYLHRCAQGVYCADAAMTADYQRVVQTAKTYFYRPGLCYSITDMAIWVARELVCRWEGCSLELTVKILRYAPDWRVRKDTCGQLIMREQLWPL